MLATWDWDKPVRSDTLLDIWSSRFRLCPSCSKLLDVVPVELRVDVGAFLEFAHEDVVDTLA